MLKSQRYLLNFVKEVGGDINYGIYKTLLSNMTSKDYKAWVEKYIRNGCIAIMTMPDGSIPFNVTTLESKLDSMGRKPEGTLTVIQDGMEYETNIPYYVVDMNIRIPSQTVDKGMSVSEGKSVGALTGQTTSASKMTLPEAGLLSGLGLDEVLKEILAVRGGDEGSQSAMTKFLTKTGEFSLADVEEYSTGSTSTQTLDAFFKGIHIKLKD